MLFFGFGGGEADSLELARVVAKLGRAVADWACLAGGDEAGG